ncbi:hypothetical protein Tsp_07835 [Trichinella spiralis]|uniref:hypothetical protein n=1 Tax=Trichinella spiralis TaxID=6334 RepID=UPI0001EFD004|nr:hypothetical protein Tsp_07835 [Trichinella spiralis]
MSKDPELDWNQRGLQCKMTAKFDLQHLQPGLFADYPSQLASSSHINPARQIHTNQQTPPPAPLTGHGRSMGQNRTDNLQKKNRMTMVDQNLLCASIVGKYSLYKRKRK